MFEEKIVNIFLFVIIVLITVFLTPFILFLVILFGSFILTYFLVNHFYERIFRKKNKEIEELNNDV